MVNIPSFMVKVSSETKIDHSKKSPFGGGRAGRCKRKKIREGRGNEQEDDDEWSYLIMLFIISTIIL